MRILLLCHSFNSLTQRLFVELHAAGHRLSVEYDINDRITEEAVALFGPDLILAPFLKRAIPARVWQRLPCLIVHPGIPGDRGPSALDWAILQAETDWGVTVLQATATMDAGPIWATALFPMRTASKSSLYRREVTEAAVQAVTESLAHFADYQAGHWQPTPQAAWPQRRGTTRPALRSSDAPIDWTSDNTATVLRKIHSGDGAPGRLDTLLGETVRLYNAKPYPATGTPGALLGHAAQGLVRATADGAVWIGHAKADHGSSAGIKCPLAQHLPAILDQPALDVTPVDPIRYTEHGAVGVIHFEMYNGALDTATCRRLRDTWLSACQRPTRVLVLAGGTEFFCNGLDLNAIEAAASPADASWANINAMDDLCLAILQTTDRLTVAALQGNAGAGGAFLALTCDAVWARAGVVLNPHYKNMGNLYGSEYWTWTLPQRRVNRTLLERRLPIGSAEAGRLGFIDAELASENFMSAVLQRAQALAEAPDYPDQCAEKSSLNRDALSACRAAELAAMQRNFYGFDASYHVARARFVHKTPQAWTPRHLAIHR